MSKKEPFHRLIFALLTFTIILWLPHFTLADSSSTLQNRIEEILKKEELVGMVWSTTTGDQTSIGSAGFSNLESMSPMEATQKMHVGSVTKTVLAIGILRMVTRNVLSLDDEVANLLPELSLKNPWKSTDPVRVRHLMEHTAGLDNLRIWQFLNSSPSAKTPLIQAFPSKNESLLTIRTKPGIQYSYSNMGYTLLGMIIETLARGPYENFLDLNILDQLGMYDSTFHLVSQEGDDKDERLAMGYLDNNAPQAALPMFLRPAGQFTTTAPDMAQFSELIMNNGLHKGKEFIRADLMEKLGPPSGTLAAQAGLGIGHGLALAMRDRHDVLGECHPGTTFGFRAYLCLFPSQGKSFFYSINTDNESADYEVLNQVFIEALKIEKTKIQPPFEGKPLDIDDLDDLKGVYVLSPNNMAEFEWIDKIFNFVYLSSESDHLVMHSLQADARPLFPLGNNLFRAADRNLTSHVFHKGDDDDWYLSDGLKTYQKESFFILFGHWLSLILGLLGLGYIIFAGLGRIVFLRFSQCWILFAPLLNLIAFAFPIVLYFQQPFLEFGEITLASFSLAALSGLLPIMLLSSAIVGGRSKPLNRRKKWDVAANWMAFQWCALLWFWDLLPLVFWT